jgi:hypothetical protein
MVLQPRPRACGGAPAQRPKSWPIWWERRAAGGSELGQLKRQIRDLIAEIRAGELERGPAAVMLQAYNVLARYLELERRRDEDALEERLEALEQSVMELAEAGARWGA